MNFRNIVTIVFILVASFIAWNYWMIARVSMPCEEPIAYSIGTFDRRFDISQKDFLSALGEAEMIWEKPSGIELFTYVPQEADLFINLIYDYRQETTKTLSDLDFALEENEATYKMLQSRYSGLKRNYDDLKRIYSAQVQEFNQNNIIYQNHVETWDSGKRNSKEQFDKLEEERARLEAKLAELGKTEAQLNEMIREINSLVGTLNRLADLLNLGAERYNTIGASRGETFTGGVYYSNEKKQEINIYEFSNRAKLVRVLAHELGHALGLEHNDDKDAIMYRLNEGDARRLSDSDLAALQALCYN